MTNPTARRERLTELLDLARTYRGWSRKRLARSLGRDASSLVPESGIPKLDLVIELAQVLDWPVEEVVRSLCSDPPPSARLDEIESSFEALDRAAAAAHREGRYADMIECAGAAMALAETPEERVRACNREAGGWDGLGRFHKAREALQRGLRERGASRDRQLLLRCNLANAYYTLWQLFEGQGVACDVIEWFAAHPPATHPARAARAGAYYARGQCARRLIDGPLTDDAPNREDVVIAARRGREDLETAARLYDELADRRNDDSYAGIAHTCRGGLAEFDVLLDRRTAVDVLDEIDARLDRLLDPDDPPVGDWLESFGWWCIFGCNIALRHLTDERQLQRRMAVFTNKADEIAGQLGNWSLRERVYTLEYARRVRFLDWSGLDSEWTIDDDDVAVITGAMGRFPVFRHTGWRILRTARIIATN